MRDAIRSWLRSTGPAIVLVSIIATIAFVVSFDAISTYAVRVGAFPPALWWAAPLLVDTWTVAAGWVIFARSGAGVRWTGLLYPWAVVDAGSAGDPHARSGAGRPAATRTRAAGTTIPAPAPTEPRRAAMNEQTRCQWCNDRRCIVGPWHALTRCPACSGGAWWPPFPAPLEPGPELTPELELEPNPCGYLASGYVPPRRKEH